MSEFSSFYGGRQGASFVIVKRFDGIDIPEGSSFKIKNFAQDDAGYFYVPLIERTDNNYLNYSRWGTIPCDGVTTVTSVGGDTSEPLPIEYLEGMRQCFEKGGETTSEVNYGEYVLIDTMAGRGAKSSPDNGKIYRRGFNYDYNPITNPLAGAEYIGQIMGPPGESPALKIDTIDSVMEHPGASRNVYTTETGLVPGKEINSQGQVVYHDELEYAYVNIENAQGESQMIIVGFTFPFMITDLTASSRKPYYQSGDTIPAGKHVGDKLNDNFNCISRIDNGEHPFYREWKINVPKGIKGDTNSNLEIYPTKVVDGSKLYGSVNSSGVLSNLRPFTAENLDIDLTNYETTKLLGYVQTEDGNYVYLTDTRGLRMRYLQTNYDNKEAGEKEWIDIGEYDTISQVALSEDGYLTVYYSYKDPVQLQQAMRWIKYTGRTNTEGVQFNNDGTITVTYNTKDSSGNNETQTFSNLISWISSTVINRNGRFKVIYNNNSSLITDKTGTENGKAIFETDLTWPTQASLTSAGVLKFMFNNNILDDIYPSTWTGEGTINRTEGSYSFIIPWLEQVKLLEDGHFNFVFNNTKNYNPNDPDWKPDQRTYAPTITWVTKAILDSNGDFKIYFNNNLNKERVEAAGETWVSDTTGEYYKKHIQWVTKVTIDANGIVHFWYNDDTEMPQITTNMKIKCIDNIYINTANDSGEEGSGDQKVHIVYNTLDAGGEHEETTVGEPINYVLDTHVVNTEDNTEFGIRGHLYVYYSDPARRQNSNVTIYSEKLGRDVTGWIDLGDIKGDTNAQLTFTRVERLTQLQNKAPEMIMGSEIGGTVIPNYRYAGWGVEIGKDNSEVPYHLGLYDYINGIWVDVGVLIDRSGITPNLFINWSTEDLTTLKTNGFVFNAETVRKTIN